jgi:hypothetical protein
MKKTAFAALGLVLTLSLCILGACTKTDAAKAADGTEAATGQTDGFSPSQVVYVAPPAGLNLRDDAKAAGKLIKTLPQNTRLVVLEKGQNEETIGGAKNFWYKVDTGSERGWVFGAHITTTTPAGHLADKIDESELCTRSLPLELELVVSLEGDEYRYPARRVINSRYGYAIYLMEGFSLRNSGCPLDYYVVARDVRTTRAEDTLTMRIYNVDPRTPIPPMILHKESPEDPGLATTYQRITAGYWTLEAEFTSWSEYGRGDFILLHTMFHSIRPVNEEGAL